MSIALPYTVIRGMPNIMEDFLYYHLRILRFSNSFTSLPVSDPVVKIQACCTGTLHSLLLHVICLFFEGVTQMRSHYPSSDFTMRAM